MLVLFRHLLQRQGCRTQFRSRVTECWHSINAIIRRCPLLLLLLLLNGRSAFRRIGKRGDRIAYIVKSSGRGQSGSAATGCGNTGRQDGRRTTIAVAGLLLSVHAHGFTNIQHGRLDFPIGRFHLFLFESRHDGIDCPRSIGGGRSEIGCALVFRRRRRVEIEFFHEFGRQIVYLRDQIFEGIGVDDSVGRVLGDEPFEIGQIRGSFVGIAVQFGHEIGRIAAFLLFHFGRTAISVGWRHLSLECGKRRRRNDLIMTGWMSRV